MAAAESPLENSAHCTKVDSPHSLSAAPSSIRAGPPAFPTAQYPADNRTFVRATHFRKCRRSSLRISNSPSTFPDSRLPHTTWSASPAPPPSLLDPSSSALQSVSETPRSGSPPSLPHALSPLVGNNAAHKSAPPRRPKIHSLQTRRVATLVAAAVRPSIPSRKSRTARPQTLSAARLPPLRFRDTPASPSRYPAPPNPPTQTRR